VSEEEDKACGVLGYKESVGFSPAFHTILHFNEFCRMRYFKFLNLVLTKILKIHSSFCRIFFNSKCPKILKILNLTDRFLMNHCRFSKNL
jgi:hypothetical protein